MSNKKDKTPHIKPKSEIQPEDTSATIGTPTNDSTSPEAHEVEPLADDLSRVEDLQKQLNEAVSLASEYKDGWQRAVADFQNYKRRVDAENKDTYLNAVGNILRRYLPVLDDMERALAHRPADQTWADGIELIYRKLQTILDTEGLKRIEAEGKLFDPHFHEAISQEPAEGVESGTVIGVVQQGYFLGDRVIRPAMVRVAQ